MQSTNAALAFYAQLASDPKMLANGHALILEFLLRSQQNRRDTLLGLTHPNIPVLALVGYIYPTQIIARTAVSEQQKCQTRSFLLQSLSKQLRLQNKTFQMLFQFVGRVHNTQGYLPWLKLYQQTLTFLIHNQHPHTVLFLLRLLKNADDRIGQLAKYLLRIAMEGSFPCTYQQRLQIVYYCLKSMAFMTDTDPQTIEKYVQPHLDNIIQTVFRGMRESLRTMKFSLKVLTIVWGEYGRQADSAKVKQIEKTGWELAVEYLSWLGKQGGNQQNSLQQDDEEDTLELAMYQYMELLLVFFGNNINVSLQLQVYLSIVGSLLPPKRYQLLCKSSDVYLMEIQDEGENSLRNKSVFLIQQHLQVNNKPVDMLRQYINAAMQNTIPAFLSKKRWPQIMIPQTQSYLESALFLLYSFTAQLLQIPKKLCYGLGNLLQSNSSTPIQCIISVLVMTKVMRGQGDAQRQLFLKFCIELVQKYKEFPGILISLTRAIYTYCPSTKILLYETVPVHLVTSLKAYLQTQDSAQKQTAHLILQFWVHLLKNHNNLQPLRQMLPTQYQLFLLHSYSHDGVTSSVTAQLIAHLADSNTLTAILQQILSAKILIDQLPAIIAKSIRQSTLILFESHIVQLIKVYRNHRQFISDIISAFLQKNTITGVQLRQLLNINPQGSWAVMMLKQGVLNNPQAAFIASARSIIQTESPHDLEKQLALPFTLILQHSQQAITLLKNYQLLSVFVNKIVSYGKLFKGPHLKMITSLVFIQIGLIQRDLRPQICKLIDSYGALEGSEWQQQSQNSQNGFMAVLNNLVNQTVEEQFKVVFGELCWDTAHFNAKHALFKQ